MLTAPKAAGDPESVEGEEDKVGGGGVGRRGLGGGESAHAKRDDVAEGELIGLAEYERPVLQGVGSVVKNGLLDAPLGRDPQSEGEGHTPSAKPAGTRRPGLRTRGASPQRHPPPPAFLRNSQRIVLVVVRVLAVGRRRGSWGGRGRRREGWKEEEVSNGEGGARRKRGGCYSQGKLISRREATGAHSLCAASRTEQTSTASGSSLRTRKASPDRAGRGLRWRRSSGGSSNLPGESNCEAPIRPEVRERKVQSVPLSSTSGPRVWSSSRGRPLLHQQGAASNKEGRAVELRRERTPRGKTHLADAI